MKNRWKGLAVAVVASSALALTACSAPSAGGGDTGSSTAAGHWPSQTASLKGVNLTIWAAQNSNATAKSVVAAFDKATGANIKIVTIPDPYEQSVQTKIQTGDKPDLAFWQPTGSELTLLNPSTNLQSLDGAPWLSSYSSDTERNIGLLNNTHYAALVTTPAVEGVYYNKDVWAKAGFSDADVPKTFDDMVTLAKKFKAKGIDPFYEMGGDKWATQWWPSVQVADAAKKGFWQDVNTNKEQFTSPVMLNAIKNYQSLVQQGLFNTDYATASFVDEGNAMLGDKVAMVLQANSFFNELQTSSDTATLNKKIGWFPIAPSGNFGTFIPDQSNALVAFNSGDSAREAGARQFLEYWLGKGYSDFVQTQKTPSIETTVATPDSVPTALQSVAKSIPDAVGSMQVQAIANPDLYLNLASMLAGTKTPLQVAQTTQAQFAQQAKAQGSTAFN